MGPFRLDHTPEEAYRSYLAPGLFIRYTWIPTGCVLARTCHRPMWPLQLSYHQQPVSEGSLVLFDDRVLGTVAGLAGPDSGTKRYRGYQLLRSACKRIREVVKP